MDRCSNSSDIFSFFLLTLLRPRFKPFYAFVLAVFIFIPSRAVLSENPLIVPGFTSYAEPNAESLEIPESGPVKHWSDSDTQLVWYGQIRTVGKLEVALRLRLAPTQQVRLGIRIDQTILPEQEIVGKGQLQIVRFGSISIAKTAPVRIELRGIKSSAKTFGEIDGLELTGPAIIDALFNLTSERGAPSVHLNYALPAGVQAEWFYGEVTAKTDPLSSHYEVCGFARGYFGIQVNSPTERRIIFSVWDSGSERRDRGKVKEKNRVKLLAKGDGVIAEGFGNEGTGGHRHLVYPWKTGDTYRFLLHAQPSGRNTIYSGYFFFPERQVWGLIARFSAPKDGHYLTHLYSFDEDFSGANGQRQRLAQFGNEWVRTSEGKWIELTSARFTHTARGLYKDRIDREAGVIGDRFYLSGGGFEPSTMQYDHVVTRPPSTTPPDLTLPRNFSKD